MPHPLADRKDGVSPAQSSLCKLAPHAPLPGYYAGSDDREEFVTELFNRTAPDYDLICQVMSFGSGRWYRHKALQQAGLREGMRVLDVACGTGSVAECASTIVGPSGSVIGLDASRGMLSQARRRGCGELVQARAEDLPFPDNHFDLVSMGYALRHVSDLKSTFVEYLRVLRPGGVLLILEISRPDSPLHLYLARLYLKSILPRMAPILTRNKDTQTLMSYLWDTIEQCVPAPTILAVAGEVGFAGCKLSERIGGLMRDYTAIKP